MLEQELARKRVRGTIGTGSMNDPYMPLEKQVELTRRALEVIARFRFPVHVLTKSDLVLRDLDLLQTISQSYATVSFTLTTVDDDLACKIEPGAPLPSARLAALRELAAAGIRTGVLLMPVLPFIEDRPENVAAIVRQAAAAGAHYIIPAFGMTLRDRQREYYYTQLDRHFPGLSERYRRTFGGRYSAPAGNQAALQREFQALCRELNVATRLTPYFPQAVKQMRLF